MRDHGWLGKYINGHDFDRDHGEPPRAITAHEPDPHPILYDANDKPLTRDKTAGFFGAKWRRA